MDSVARVKMAIFYRKSDDSISVKDTVRVYRERTARFVSNILYSWSAHKARNEIAKAGNAIHHYEDHSFFDRTKMDEWIDASMGGQNRLIDRFVHHTCGGDAAVAYSQLYIAAAKGYSKEAFNEKSFLWGLAFPVMLGQRTDREQTIKDIREINSMHHFDFDKFPLPSNP